MKVVRTHVMMPIAVHRPGVMPYLGLVSQTVIHVSESRGEVVRRYLINKLTA